MSRKPPTLARAFGSHVRGRALVEPGEHILVALSGGLDSVALVHLLRFHPPVADLRITGAHFDHAMRPDSAADARWVEGLARAWKVTVRVGSARGAPGSQAEARSARYAFLRRVAAEVRADRIATAHHADDQAETVLFRAVRGTGVRGLAGIPERGEDGLVRPILPFWREELEAYAEAVGLPWRPDPTNRTTAYARNALRHRVLPLLEADVAPGARRALVRLARLARRDDEAWRSLLPDLLAEAVLEEGAERIVVAREGLVAHDPALRARLLRALAERLGSLLDEAGTRTAMEFTSAGPSGGGVDLPGGLRLRRDFDHLVLFRPSGAPSDAPPEGRLTVLGGGPGSGRLSLGGRTWTVRWGLDVRAVWTVSLPAGALSYPLCVRAWQPGDRIRLSYGSKKLAKLFAEGGVPVPERHQRPVLVDAEGRVLWVPGLARSAEVEAGGSGEPLTLGIDDADAD